MFDIITKKDYWDWLEEGIVQSSAIQATRDTYSQRPLSLFAKSLFRVWHRVKLLQKPERLYELKDVQDGFIMSRLQGSIGFKRILEVGGGDPRILRWLAKDNECWLVDKFEGVGRGPKRIPNVRGIKIIEAYMGEFVDAIPSDYFDHLFSISVVEHIPLNQLEAFFSDCARVLKLSGRMFHAIDTYVFDNEQKDLASISRERIREYLKFAYRPDLGIRLVSAPRIDENLTFSCSYASLPDNALHAWHLNRPSEKRVFGQVVSIKSEWVKYQ